MSDIHMIGEQSVETYDAKTGHKKTILPSDHYGSVEFDFYDIESDKNTVCLALLDINEFKVTSLRKHYKKFNQRC